MCDGALTHTQRWKSQSRDLAAEKGFLTSRLTALCVAVAIIHTHIQYTHCATLVVNPRPCTSVESHERKRWDTWESVEERFCIENLPSNTSVVQQKLCDLLLLIQHGLLKQPCSIQGHNKTTKPALTATSTIERDRANHSAAFSLRRNYMGEFCLLALSQHCWGGRLNLELSVKLSLCSSSALTGDQHSVASVGPLGHTATKRRRRRQRQGSAQR